MAYDSYRQSPGPYDQTANSQPPSSADTNLSASAPPYPSQYGTDRMDMPHPQMPPGPPSQPPNPDPTWQQQPQPGRINEAVNSAYSQSGSPGYLSPELLSHITANVIQQLKATGLDNLQGQQPPPPTQQPWPAPSGPVHYAEASPATGAQNPWQYQTPPPPHYQPPPQQPWSPAPGSTPAYPETQPMNAQNQVPSRPPSIVAEHADSQPYAASGYASSPRTSSKASSVHQPERRESPLSQGSDHKQNAEARPKASRNDATLMELTTLEKIWGKLFENGRPTDRLGQFLRGIAVYLIEEYSPGNTIVIVPEKMQRFYEDTSVESDPYPWEDIFDDGTSSISRLFRDLEAEHHLVQEKRDERPDIPALTPRGFQRWATLMIQANPEREYERLQKAVLNMPINNPDDKRERFPKEIPRRLFPEVPNLALRERIDQTIMRHCHLELPPISDEDISKAARPSKPSGVSTKNPTELSQSGPEGGRQTYATSSAIADEEEESNSPRPIERERKPYTAQPGGGRVYNETKPSVRGHTGSFPTSPRPKEDFLTASPRHRHSDLYNQESPYSRASGAGNRHPTENGGRSRSSSRSINVRPDYRNSEGEPLDRDSHRHSGIPSTGEYYYDPAKSNLPGDMAEDSRRYRDLDQDAEDKRFHESIRERERERDKKRYRSSWTDGGDYHRGAR